MAACDVPGIKRLLPSSWRELKIFNNIYELVLALFPLGHLLSKSGSLCTVRDLTPVKKLFLAGSYTKQIAWKEQLSGRQASAYICNAREELVALRKELAAFELIIFLLIF
ncbi:hypothetical protein CUMW_220100 [Citrus unshiu]|uniref:Uncharacterized protein n=1 Tax=Citrus unshiu TaxID=55188 RepID=A0A2H5QDR1_CITUN|nr:hypothetical protein CUMW_220100 [Citrus unshiu]